MANLFETRSDKIFRIVITAFLVSTAFVSLYPILNIASTSVSSGFMADRGKVYLLPREFNLESWGRVVKNQALWRSLFNTVSVTVIGTFCSLAFTAVLAYSLANRNNKLRGIISFLIVFTMVFRYPMIPYFLSVKSYGLVNKLSVLVFAHLIIAYNLIIMRTFFKQLPVELEESALVEGAGHGRILFQICLPLSKAVMATLGLFYAVTYWNLYLHPLLFIRDEKLYTLQPRLRALLDLVNSTEDGDFNAASVQYSSTTVRAAIIMFSTIPILMVYPYLQKYFVKGAMVGSVKG